MKGEELMDALANALERDENRTLTDRELSKKFGYSYTNIGQIRKKKKITPEFVANLVKRARKNSEQTARESALRTVVEFFPITKCESKQKAKFEIIPVVDNNGNDFPYLQGLRTELEETKGVYVFFDSRGKAIYVGSTKQNLWSEMKSAFNRSRTPDVQQVFRVKHPMSTRQQKYKSSKEKVRQIKKVGIQLHELAYYFSAYAVHKEIIGEIEALLIRSSANDLLNVKMEKIASKK